MERSVLSKPFKDEFLLSKFGLSYPDPDVFVRSQWQRPRWFYFFWRLFWLLWHLGWIIASGVNTRINNARYAEESGKWFIYLTNTTLLLTTLTCLVDFVIVLYVTAAKDGTVLGLPDNLQRIETTQTSTVREDGMKEEIVFRGNFIVEEGLKEYTTSWYLKFVWFLYNVISSSNIIITIMYWTVVYTGKTDVVGAEVHTINSVFIILNLLVTAMPVQILHFIYPVAYGALYFLFNFIYIISGGTDLQGRKVIYTVIDWNTPFPTAVVVVLGLLVAVPLGHLLVFAVYTLRLYIHSKVYSASYSTRRERLHSDNRTASTVESGAGIEVETCTPL